MMHSLKYMRSLACVLHIRQVGKSVRVGNRNDHFLPKRFARLLCTSASLQQHPRHEAVIMDTERGVDSKVGEPGLEDLLFYTITQGEQKISVARFISELESTGLLISDPRLRDCMQQLHQLMHETAGTAVMDQELFRKETRYNAQLFGSSSHRWRMTCPPERNYTQLSNYK